jgi:CheY-like chemotaxis protein
MSVLLLSADVAMSSMVSAAAVRCGVACETAWSADSVVDKARSLAPRLIVLDLGTPGAEVATLVPALRDLPTPPRRIVAFGPHVHETRLAAAREAGCDSVVSRGRFHADVDEIIAASLREA